MHDFNQIRLGGHYVVDRLVSGMGFSSITSHPFGIQRCGGLDMFSQGQRFLASVRDITRLRVATTAKNFFVTKARTIKDFAPSCRG